MLIGNILKLTFSIISSYSAMYIFIDCTKSTNSPTCKQKIKQKMIEWSIWTKLPQNM